MNSSNLAIALIHHPAVDKNGDIVTTSVTTLDVHDMARLCKTYGIGSLYIVTPLQSQARLVERITRHWTQGWGGTYNPSRKEALGCVKIVDTIERMVDTLSVRGADVDLIATGARENAMAVSYATARERLKSMETAVLLFGTGHGLAVSVFERVSMVVEPIVGAGDFNHLPVRCAAAIILDRLIGREGLQEK